MGEVHQIVDHQPVAGLDMGVAAPGGELVGRVEPAVIRDQRGVGQRRVAGPDPDDAVPLHHRVRARPEAIGRPLDVRVAATDARRVDLDPVIGADDMVAGHAAKTERHGAMRADVMEDADAAKGTAEDHQRVAQDGDRDRLVGDVSGPGGHVPRIVDETHRPSPTAG